MFFCERRTLQHRVLHIFYFPRFTAFARTITNLFHHRGTALKMVAPEADLHLQMAPESQAIPTFYIKVRI